MFNIPSYIKKSEFYARNREKVKICWPVLLVNRPRNLIIQTSNNNQNPIFCPKMETCNPVTTTTLESRLQDKTPTILNLAICIH